MAVGVAMGVAPQQLLQGVPPANIYRGPGPGQVLGTWGSQDKASLASDGLIIPSPCRALCQELHMHKPIHSSQ